MSIKVCVNLTHEDEIAANKVVITLENLLSTPKRQFLKVKDLELHGIEFTYKETWDWYCEELTWEYGTEHYCLKVYCNYLYLPNDVLYDRWCTIW